MVALLLVILVPSFQTDPALSPPEDPRAAWLAVAQVVLAAGASLPARHPPPIAIRAGALRPGHAGASTPGLIEMRLSGDALRHEMSHQLLFWACPSASGDRLFHEAFAVAAAGELGAFAADTYVSLPAAVAALDEARSLDTRGARRALERILVETLEPGASLPTSVQRRLRGCASGGPWTATSPAELASADELAGADAAIVVSRHSGEVLIAQGAARAPLPFGSTLKPFVVAGLPSRPPPLPVRRGAPEWACGDALPPSLDGFAALARSCNGWFLDLAARDPAAHALGAFAAPLLRLGLSRAPASMAEAIGLQPSLSLSPWALAQAYRLLAEARPDVLEALRRTAVDGTLADLPGSDALRGIALKTGTVRDVHSRPRLGWMVAVDADFVAVVARPGRMPRSFPADMVALLSKARRLAATDAARVQVFGLVDPDSVEASCKGVGLAVDRGVPRVAIGWQRLADLTARGPAICLAQPWRVRFPRTNAEGRDYAGVFTRSAAAGLPAIPARTEAERRARRGSELVFRTTRLLYAAGVAEAEAAHLGGEGRAALLRIVSHNERHGRHRDRPVCDTTHCQVFKGTVPQRPGDRVALARPELPWMGWLHFSAGGIEPWEERRGAAEVQSVFGADPGPLRFDDGRAYFLRTRIGGDPDERLESVPCDLLRGALHLPSCPDHALRDGTELLFSGHGSGHGIGLDIDAAARSGLDQDDILRLAFGKP